MRGPLNVLASEGLVGADLGGKERPALQLCAEAAEASARQEARLLPSVRTCTPLQQHRLHVCPSCHCIILQQMAPSQQAVNFQPWWLIMSRKKNQRNDSMGFLQAG